MLNNRISRFFVDKEASVEVQPSTFATLPAFASQALPANPQQISGRSIYEEAWEQARRQVAERRSQRNRGFA